MKRSRKSNKVTWAHASNLCQVRLFLSEDCPSQAGNEGENSLKIKSTKNLQPSKDKDSNELPPGFGRPYFQRKLLKPISTHIPTTHWSCPPKFGLSYNWNVVAGEESKEVKVQKLRESRVLEALYPSPAAIPANSIVSLDVEGEFYDDSFTPNIPIIPIEQEEEATNVPPCFPEPASNSSNSKPSSVRQTLLSYSIPNSTKCSASAQQEKPASGILPNQDTRLVTAAAIAVMKSKEQGSLVDTDLLVKILSDPKMVLKLASDFQKPTVSAGEQTVPSKPVTQFVPNPTPAPFPCSRNLDNLQPSLAAPSWPKPVIAAERGAIRVSGASPTVGNLVFTANQVQANLNTAPSLESTVAQYFGTNPKPLIGSGLMSNQSKTVGQTCISSVRTNPTKDLNYFKNLIREHGIDKSQDRNIAQNFSDHNNMRPREVNPQFQKACFYFKTPKGCRSGSNCPYQHDFSYQLQTFEAPPIKRMRLSGEISNYW